MLTDRAEKLTRCTRPSTYLEDIMMMMFIGVLSPVLSVREDRKHYFKRTFLFINNI